MVSHSEKQHGIEKGKFTIEDQPQLCSESSDNCSFKESDVSELLGRKVQSEDAAYNLYNDYSFRKCFGTRKHNIRYRSDGSIIGREFVCYKEGNKVCKGKGLKQFTKLDVRSGCKAKVYFKIADDGLWTVVSHNMVHNHPFCEPDSVHLIRSHRDMNKAECEVLKRLVASGVTVADAIRYLKAEKGGVPFLGFKPRDAYNHLAKDKKQILDGTDANTLINIFKGRQANEHEFYFDFEVDQDCFLVNFFWRDKKMRDDYFAFGDLMVFDTTFRTNKYNMVCAPFVGINNHTHNCMFGCGFLTNQRKESFAWLFSTFLRSMEGKQPRTIMTDQDLSMANVIPKVFTSSRHRLCTWHILENSKNNIQSLRRRDGFTKLFNHVLMYCDTIPEFDHYWQRLQNEYDINSSSWMTTLHGLRTKWCPAFSKDFFSGGVLSSQRSESTNHAICRKITATASLCDFYNIFSEVVSEWRINEKEDNHRCWEGVPELAFDLPILNQCARVYTIDAYRLFEEGYREGLKCNQILRGTEGYKMFFDVWMPNAIFAHCVMYELGTNHTTCTCKKFEESGILCCHCLRIYMIYGVHTLPDLYILKRWTKAAKPRDEEQSAVCSAKSDVAASIWRLQMHRKFDSLIMASDSNAKARCVCEDLFIKGKTMVEAEVGCIYTSATHSEVNNDQGCTILNPKGSRKKGERNVRRKSIVEKKHNIARGRKKMIEKRNISISNDQTTPSTSSQLPLLPQFIHASSNIDGVPTTFQTDLSLSLDTFHT